MQSFDGIGHDLPDFRRLLSQIRAKKGLCSDLERDAHRVMSDVNLPIIEHEPKH